MWNMNLDWTLITVISGYLSFPVVLDIIMCSYHSIDLRSCVALCVAREGYYFTTISLGWGGGRGGASAQGHRFTPAT